MGIGTSDGKYYPSEMEQALHELNSDVTLDPLTPETSFNDTPTPQQRARDGSIYNNLRDQEHQMEDNLNKPIDEDVKTPVTPVGDKSPDEVLGTFQGNHEGALVWGERNHQEAYVEKYGYEHTLDILNKTLESNKVLDGSQTGGGAWYKDIKDYRDELLSRQGASNENSSERPKLASDLTPMSGELSKLPRITVTPKESEEKVTATDKRGFWNQITGADGQPRYKLFPERMLDHITDSAEKFSSLLKGDAKLPSKGGVPGAADATDPDALRNLGAVTDMAGFLIMGPGRDAAIQASPVTFQKAQQSLASIERITPQPLRGGVEHIGSLEHPELLTLEEQLAEIMRPRSRAEAAAADPTRSYIRQPNVRPRPRDSIEEAISAIEESLYGRGGSSRAAREAGANEMAPRGWRNVEGGATSPGSTAYRDLPGMTSKTINFANKDGQKFYVEATNYGEHLAVGMIGSLTKDGYKMGIDTKFANTMGVSGMRTVLRKLQEEFPGAKTISGFRVTGARGSQGGGRALVNLPQK